MKTLADILSLLVKVVDTVVSFVDNTVGLETILAVLAINTIPSLVVKIKTAIAAMEAAKIATMGWKAALSLLAIGIGAAITAVKTYNSAKEESRQMAVDDAINGSKAAMNEAESYKETVKTLSDLQKEYKQLYADKGSLGWTSEQREKAKSLQAQINSYIDDQSKRVDLINGKYETQLDLLTEIAEEEREAAKASAERALRDAKDAMTLAGLKDEKYDEFVQEYEMAQKQKDEWADQGKRGTYEYRLYTEWLGEYKEFYENYIKAKKTLDEIDIFETGGSGAGSTSGASAATADLEEQIDAYKELIDLRKKLLKQYKEELDYKKKLAEQEKTVSDLQTQLAISQLDTSAAGQAKTRELAQKLQEAQDSLDDFTLEHAIDVVTAELDTQLEEYEKIVNNQTDTIVGAINNVAIAIQRPSLSGHIRSEYISDSSLQVSVPRTMNGFVASSASGITTSNGANEFNAPLISVQVGSVTEDTLPHLNSVVNDAVKEIKRMFDDGMSRAGYRKRINMIN